MVSRSVQSRRGVLLALAPVTLLIAACSSSISSASRPEIAIPMEPRAVLVIPGESQRALAQETGIPVSIGPGRRDARLGGIPIRGEGPSAVSVQIRDNQRVINGRVRSQTSWRVRTSELRSQIR